MIIEPVTLEGERVRLRPLMLDDVPALAAIGTDEDTWRWIPTQVRNETEMREYVDTALVFQARGSALPFVIVDKVSGKVAGCTRFGNIEKAHKRLEIGWTWLGPAFRRSHVNTEAKFLLFQHAFESLGMNRVELKTDALNERSRAAILRLGAKQEGILRSHMVTWSGRLRDTVYFSVIAPEWPAVKAALWARMHR
jgi:RimJ/RimL family protein N-acetyltransferase